MSTSAIDRQYRAKLKGFRKEAQRINDLAIALRPGSSAWDKQECRIVEEFLNEHVFNLQKLRSDLWHMRVALMPR